MSLAVADERTGVEWGTALGRMRARPTHDTRRVGPIDQAAHARVLVAIPRWHRAGARLLAELDRGEADADGQRILELGCGWGSLTLWMAATYPDAEVVALSNSRTQREHIEKQAADRGLANLHVITADVSTFDPADHGEAAPFDRVVSVEMLEHVRNHGVLFERISRWLADDGLFFTHVFAGADVCFRYDAVFGHDDGEAFGLSHHLFRPRR